jgi:hypothetical protein
LFCIFYLISHIEIQTSQWLSMAAKKKAAAKTTTKKASKKK